MVQALVFYLLASVVVASAVMVILARNPVHSVLWLILAFFNAAGIMISMGAEFLGMILVIVYVGAVAVLFLFVVMMLDIDFEKLRGGFMRNLPLGLLIGIILAVELVLIAGAWQFGGFVPDSFDAPVAAAAGLTNTQAIGTILYTDYVFIFQSAGIILLIAMIGAIVLTHRERKGVRRQSVREQQARSPENAVSLARPKVGAGVDTDAGVR
ncbi:MAG: NADH-quinone oxidoreductase subunit J [Thermaurantiacus sp.]